MPATLGELMDRILFGALLLLGVGVLSVRYLDQTGRAPVNAAPVQVAAPPANSRGRGGRGSAGGHFAVEARVDGRRIPFMIDTGASQITIRESDAARLRVPPHGRHLSPL